jgi:hypothetical protein
MRAGGGLSRAAAGARPSGWMPGTSPPRAPAPLAARAEHSPTPLPAGVNLNAASAVGARDPGRRASGWPRHLVRGADGSGWLPWAMGLLTLGAAARSPAQGRVLGGGARAQVATTLRDSEQRLASCLRLS